MLDNQVEECVDGVQPAAVNSDLPERLSDHRRIGAFDNFGVEEEPPKFKGTMELSKETAAA